MVCQQLRISQRTLQKLRDRRFLGHTPKSFHSAQRQGQGRAICNAQPHLLRARVQCVEVKKKVIGDEEQITCRPADLLENELDKIEKEMIQYKKQDEDVLTYALFPQVATDFFKYREAQDKKVDVTLADKDSTAYPV